MIGSCSLVTILTITLPRISKVWHVLQACYRQLWYCTGDIVVMALVDPELGPEEKEKLAKAIHETPKPEKPRQGKPVFPDMTFLLAPHPRPPSLSTLVTTDSWAIFNRLGLQGPNVGC